MRYLEQLIQQRQHGKKIGIYSCCSSNDLVIRAALRRARDNRTMALIEATANQVNQNGGYTGMRPADFYRYVMELAKQEGVPESQILLGGDHLGPLTFSHLPEAEAMEQAEELVRQYVEAGFAKIHLDTSMRVADDDPNAPLADAVIACRGARLCAVAEAAYQKRLLTVPDAPAPNYIIGSEVPIPGGTQEYEDSVAVTTPEAYETTVATFREAFRSAGLEDTWNRVIAVVVQPGVEFGDATIVKYDHDNAIDLLRAVRQHPQMMLEGHSTDYQPKECLRQMVEDGIAILKVGPALTFGLREGLFALENIERELCFNTPSSLRDAMESVMVEEPKYWKKYYTGTEAEQKYARAFSLSDRVRYYLPNERIQAAIGTLLDNLSHCEIPIALLHQYLPRQAERVSSGKVPNRAEDLLLDHIGDWIDDYLYATNQMVQS